MSDKTPWKTRIVAFVGVLLLGSAATLHAVPVPGGTLNPTTVPKYVKPLVIPPVMDDAGTAAGLTPTPNTYDIAVRQFLQQILPAPLPPTTVWSYGPAADPIPAIAPAATSQFNYPGYTLETTANTAVNVKWRNELVTIDPATGFPYPEGSANRTYLPHLLPVDQTLHWANPPGTGCLMGDPNRVDCHTDRPDPYLGPVPIVTHLHGAHVDAHSDGYPEAWWLPKASNIPAGYVTEGDFFDDALGQLPGTNSGYADYRYRNDQAATTLWFHDHSLGMTRSNVYAGPAGFWLIRGGTKDLATGLPGPAPTAGQTVTQLNSPGNAVRQGIREIPVVIQDRSFNADGSLFYPPERAFFEGVANNATLGIPFIGNPTGTTPGPSDIAPLWNPEAFFNTMVVNGATWPKFDVAPALYRLRLLNGSNSRTLNLSMLRLYVTATKKKLGQIDNSYEIPFYQIGGDQGFIPRVVRVQRGFATPLTPGVPLTSVNQLRKGPSKQQALLLGPAERADVLIDFRGLPNGTKVRMYNTAPDTPFGGFPDIPADPATTGQVMQFTVNVALDGKSATDPAGTTPALDPWMLTLPAPAALGATTNTRQVSLNEEVSNEVCVSISPQGTITYIPGVTFSATDPTVFINACAAAGGVPFGPKAAKLGTVGTDPVTGAPIGIPRNWDDMTAGSIMANVTLHSGTPGAVTKMVSVTENPALGSTEEWDIYNFTVDAHPIHVHQVAFKVLSRTPIGTAPVAGAGITQLERGFKDTVIAYPGQVTRIKATFDIAGLYVWHCHILEHEDNEMMRPYVVSP
ncbi:MAG: copper oxidase [Desulfuromonas sp.]|nr:copper oxidase [Desulfuromonas sp.]